MKTNYVKSLQMFITDTQEAKFVHIVWFIEEILLIWLSAKVSQKDHPKLYCILDQL